MWGRACRVSATMAFQMTTRLLPRAIKPLPRNAPLKNFQLIDLL